MDGRLAAVNSIENDERVDLKVGEVEVNVDRVEADEEVDKSLLLCGGNMLEEGVGDDLPGREGLADGDVELKSLSVDITDVDTTLVCEQDSISLTQGVDADIVFCV